MRQKIALLWDIDGTLLTTSGLGRGPLIDAIQSSTGHKGDYDLISSSGLTDHQIVNQIVEPLGLSEESLGELINQILEDYCARYAELLITKKLKILNRVDDILQVLHEQENILNLICTGNFIQGAKMKLSNVGLDKYFPDQNYFCSQSLGNRSEIVARAKNMAGDYGYEPIVIGDTIHDIEASRINGVKCIALESESYSFELLKVASPHALLGLGWDLKQLENAIYAS